MTIKAALKKILLIQEKILIDERLSIEELSEVLEFIKPYSNKFNKNFKVINRFIKKINGKQHIDYDDREELFEALKQIESFLKVERMIETGFYWIVAVTIGAVMIALFS